MRVIKKVFEIVGVIALILMVILTVAAMQISCWIAPD